MARYRCLFVDHAGRVYATEAFECIDDPQAIARAEHYYASNIGRGVELWRDDQCVHIRNGGSRAPAP